MDPEMIATPQSSNVEEIGYDHEYEEVWVRFQKTGLYIYSSVPPAVWEEFEAAASKGNFVNTVLKPGFSYRKG